MAEVAQVKIGGIIRHRALCLIGVMSAPDRPGIAAAIFRTLGQAGLNAQFIVQNIDLNHDAHVQFCVAGEDCERVRGLIEPVALALGAQKVIVSGSVALIAVFGPDFRERPGIAGLTFGALAEAGINILAVSTSISTISCIIQDEECERAIAALGSVFSMP